MNVGKIFENGFIKSIPDYAWHIRIPDAAQSFAPNPSLRFSRKNPFDFIVWNPNTLTLYALELKTTKGKSISFERDKKENKAIHYHQIDGLSRVDKYDGIVSGFVIEFRELTKTVFISISEFNKLISIINKSSINYDDLDTHDIKYIEIPQQLLKTHYQYDIQSFFDNTGLNGRKRNEV